MVIWRVPRLYLTRCLQGLKLETRHFRPLEGKLESEGFNSLMRVFFPSSIGLSISPLWLPHINKFFALLLPATVLVQFLCGALPHWYPFPVA